MRGVRYPAPRGGQRWRIFLRNHTVWACDFVQTYDIWFRPIFAFFIALECCPLDLGRCDDQLLTKQGVLRDEFRASPQDVVGDPGDQRQAGTQSPFGLATHRRRDLLARSRIPGIGSSSRRSLSRPECARDHPSRLQGRRVPRSGESARPHPTGNKGHFQARLPHPVAQAAQEIVGKLRLNSGPSHSEAETRRTIDTGEPRFRPEEHPVSSLACVDGTESSPNANLNRSGVQGSILRATRSQDLNPTSIP